MTLFDIGPAAPTTIPAGHGRYMYRCSGSEHGSWAYDRTHHVVPCPPLWVTLPEERRRVSVGYGGYQTTIRPLCPPVRCSCGAWLSSPVRLEVSSSAQEHVTHTCENTCQWSESKKCRCACGGAAHGRMLREWDR